MPSPASGSIADFAIRWICPLAVVLTCVATLCLSERTDRLVQTTIHAALLLYAAALWLMSSMSPADWQAETRRGRLARELWTWACAALLVHVASAFHFVHHWSQQRALEQTRLESGVAEGLHVNYLFMAAWTADAFWWRWRPLQYARRPGGIDIVLHTGMLFIAFNAVVVFEKGPVRWIGAGLASLLATRWTMLRARRRNAASASSAS